VNTAPTSASELRVEGTNATDGQVARACANVGNQIFNGDFELADSNDTASGWSFSADSSLFYFLSFADNTQHTYGGNHEGRFVSEDATASGRIYQPLTLCPNSTYSLTAWTRQVRQLAECTATFSISGEVVGQIMPSSMWGDYLSNAVNYTVGATNADASVDFAVAVSCTGSGDANGQRTLDVDDLELTVVM
jgi:hypothetical protein